VDGDGAAFDDEDGGGAAFDDEDGGGAGEDVLEAGGDTIVNDPLEGGGATELFTGCVATDTG
jgi:hypothetical protein